MPRTLNIVSDGLVVLLLVCAVALSARTLGDIIRRAGREPTRPQRTLAAWEAYANAGHRAGSVDAALTMVVFWDYECVTCRVLESRTAPLRREHPEDLAVLYRPFPLVYHLRGAATALAVECAAEQGRFDAFHRTLMAAGDSFAARPWVRVATESGMLDTLEFERCMSDPATMARLDVHKDAAGALGIAEVPTFLLQGDLYTGVPWDYERLVERRLEKLRHSNGAR